jgi:hypothetical protein
MTMGSSAPLRSSWITEIGLGVCDAYLKSDNKLLIAKDIPPKFGCMV